MIVGLDKDEPGIFESCLRFLQRQRIDALQLNILTPLPGTPLFHEMQRAGRITDSQWDRYDFRHVVFQPRRMTAVQLQEGADWLYAQFYRADRILLRFPAIVEQRFQFLVAETDQREIHARRFWA